MPFPLIPILAIGGASALGLGGYQFGRSVGENVGKTIPYIAGAIVVYMAYNTVKK